MIDPVTTGFAVVNTILAFGGIIMTFYGQYWFKEGLLVKTLKRGSVAATLLFLHYLLDALGYIGFLAVLDLVSKIFEFGFTIALAYLTFAFIRDWKTSEKPDGLTQFLVQMHLSRVASL